MRWPFVSWGATAVFAGHDHDYERLNISGMPYFVNGLGGESIVGFGTTNSGSQVRYAGDYGAMKIDATDTSINFQFITRTGKLIDSYTLGSTTTPPPPDTTTTVSTLVATGSTWTYLDNGTDQGTAWRSSSFSDSLWKSGAAQLGYGDGDEVTKVSYGPSATNKYVTTYFRRAFDVKDASAITALRVSFMVDDGTSVYVNGTEVKRFNLPSTVGYRTYAVDALGGTDETLWRTYTIDKSLLKTGTNVIAVEVHQSDPDSSDISFDLHLKADVTTTTTTTATSKTSTATSTAQKSASLFSTKSKIKAVSDVL
jgi:hypothetical protein